jgi:hypothetical protein
LNGVGRQHLLGFEGNRMTGHGDPRFGSTH